MKNMHLHVARPVDDGLDAVLPGIEESQNIIPQGSILSQPKTYAAIESGSGLTQAAATQIAYQMMAAAALDPAQERALLFSYVTGAQKLLRPDDSLYAIGVALLARQDSVSMPQVPFYVLQKVIDDRRPAADTDSRFVMGTPNLDGFNGAQEAAQQKNSEPNPLGDYLPTPIAA